MSKCAIAYKDNSKQLEQASHLFYKSHKLLQMFLKIHMTHQINYNTESHSVLHYYSHVHQQYKWQVSYKETEKQ